MVIQERIYLEKWQSHFFFLALEFNSLNPPLKGVNLTTNILKLAIWSFDLHLKTFWKVKTNFPFLSIVMLVV